MEEPEIKLIAKLQEERFLLAEENKRLYDENTQLRFVKMEFQDRIYFLIQAINKLCKRATSGHRCECDVCKILLEDNARAEH